MGLLDSLVSNVTSESSLNALASKTGINPQILKLVVTAAVPMVLKYLKQNASSEAGITSLLGALTQHASTKSMPELIDEADEEDGGKIIGHIFGEDTAIITNELAKETGAEENQVTSILSALAPSLLSGISAATSAQGEGGLDLSSLTASAGMDLLGSLLGGDEGSAAGGILGMIKGLFS